MAVEGSAPSDSADAGLVELSAAGDSVKGEFHCAACGYGVTVCRQLPRCPMCGGASWEQTTWHPFSRDRQLAGA